MAVITFGRQAEIRLTPAVITQDNKDGVFSRIPGKIGQDSTGCLLCALREASLLVGGSEGVRTQVIVVTSSQVDNQADIRHSLESLSKKTQLMMLMMNNQWLLDHTTATMKIFHVDENEQKSVSDLYDILALTLNDNLDASSNQNVKFFSAQFMVESNERLSGKFVVESNLQENMFVMTSSVMQEDIELFQLTSPTGDIYNFPILDKGQAYFRFSGSAEAGVWSYSVKLTPTTIMPRVPVYVAAYADSSATSHSEIQLEGWTDTDTSDDAADESPRPVIIYARVTDNELPVVGAEVIAHVTRPDGDIVDIVLHDSGTGYPDLESDDGIYSAYFTQFSQLAGLYSIKIEVRNHEGRASVASSTAQLTSDICGISYTPATHHIPSLHFTRYIRIPSFFLARGVRLSMQDGVPVRKDVYPPARITDLLVSGLHQLVLELTWTATGDDLDTGSAVSYDLRWAGDRMSIMEQFDTEANKFEQSELPTPSPFGFSESVNLTVPKVNTQLYFAIVAVDAAGNSSPVSNIVPVYVSQEEIPEPEDSQLSHVSSLTLPEMSTSAWVYILSISLATVTLIIIMLLVIVIRRRRMRKLQENCPIPYFIELGPPQHHHTDKAERQLVPSVNTTTDYPDDTLSYPTSPVKTHPVMELYEHHARQYQMYQQQQGQLHSDSCRSSSSSSDTGSGSDKQSDRESPWQRQYRHSHNSDKHDSVVSNNSDSQASSSSSSSHRQSRRRRESFV